MADFCAGCGNPIDQPGSDLCRACDSRVVNVETPMWQILGADPPDMVYEMEMEGDPIPIDWICRMDHHNRTIHAGMVLCAACAQTYEWDQVVSAEAILRSGAYLGGSDRESYYSYEQRYYALSYIEPGQFRLLRSGDIVPTGNHAAGSVQYWEVP